MPKFRSDQLPSEGHPHNVSHFPVASYDPGVDPKLSTTLTAGPYLLQASPPSRPSALPAALKLHRPPCPHGDFMHTVQGFTRGTLRNWDLYSSALGLQNRQKYLHISPQGEGEAPRGHLLQLQWTIVTVAFKASIFNSMVDGVHNGCIYSEGLGHVHNSLFSLCLPPLPSSSGLLVLSLCYSELFDRRKLDLLSVPFRKLSFEIFNSRLTLFNVIINSASMKTQILLEFIKIHLLSAWCQT